jgi:ABC-type dipeptide/oligopeptide/nickel transport system permease subunit
LAGLIILAEVTLGYLGFTYQQPEPSFGNIFIQARENIFSSWWLLFIPGLFLILLNFLFMYFELFFKNNIKNLKEKYF